MPDDERLKAEPIFEDRIQLILGRVEQHHLGHALIKHSECLILMLNFYPVAKDMSRSLRDAVVRPQDLLEDQALGGPVFTGRHGFLDLTNVDIFHFTLESKINRGIEAEFASDARITR